MKQTITLTCWDNKSITVEASVIGPWAIHPRALRDGFDPVHWTITHIPTGLSLATRVPTKSHATAIAKKVMEVAPEWSTVTSTKQTPEYRAIAAKTRRFVEEFR